MDMSGILCKGKPRGKMVSLLWRPAFGGDLKGDGDGACSVGCDWMWGDWEQTY